MKKLCMAFACLFGMEGDAQVAPVPFERINTNLYAHWSNGLRGMDGALVSFGDKTLPYLNGYLRFTDSVNIADTRKFTQLMTGELLGIVRHGDTLINEFRAVPRTELPGFDTIHLNLERLGKTATTYTLQIQPRDITLISSIRLIDRFTREERVIPRTGTTDIIFSVRQADTAGTQSKRPDRFILVVDGPSAPLAEGAPAPIRKSMPLRLTVAPNPVSPGGMMTIWFHQDMLRGSALTMSTMQGSVVATWSVTGAMTRQQMPSVPPGTYILTLQSGTQRVSTKLIVASQAAR